jgi:hypothetical protein
MQANCQGDEAYTFEETADIKVVKNDKVKTNEGAYDIDLNFKNLKVTIGASADAVKLVNSAPKLCSQKADWAAKQTRDVTANSGSATCYLAKVPRQVYTVYKVDGSTLYLGPISNSAISASSRPKTLDGGTKMQRQ